jgi:leucyl-tRNA synthetase
MVQGLTFRNPSSGRYIAPSDVIDQADPKDPVTGEQLETFFEKMSKSKHNGVDPAAVIDRYGADTARMFILFKAPPEKDLEWDDADVEGQFRFLQRIWRLVHAARERGLSLGTLVAIDSQETLTTSEQELRRAVHTAIAAISEDLDGDFQFNTAISELMKLSNAMGQHLEASRPVVACEALRALLILLAPFAPHLAEDLWLELGGRTEQDELLTSSVHRQLWPVVDHTALIRDTITVVVQIKGKVRGNLQVPADADSQTIEELALTSEIAEKWLQGRRPSRVIVVPGKLVNLVP